MAFKTQSVFRALRLFIVAMLLVRLLAWSTGRGYISPSLAWVIAVVFLIVFTAIYIVFSVQSITSSKPPRRRVVLPPGTHDAEIWSRLLDGASLETLGLKRIRGRFDLRGLTAPKPPSEADDVARQALDDPEEDGIVVSDACWKNLDFSNSQLSHLRFEDCVINNCLFDRANCNDWQLRGTTLIDCSFHAADLRNARLNGVDATGKRNSFRNVDFTGAELPEKSVASIDFSGCIFSENALVAANRRSH